MSELRELRDALNRVIAEQEAISPAPQEARAYAEAKLKGSSVEYYRDCLVAEVRDRAEHGMFFTALRELTEDYLKALSASPDPEGSWEWVPKGWVIAPEEPTIAMINNVTELSVSLTDKGKYRYMLAARPPVPKKGERG